MQKVKLLDVEEFISLGFQSIPSLYCLHYHYSLVQSRHASDYAFISLVETIPDDKLQRAYQFHSPLLLFLF
jgi:hypothetical protein